MKIRILPFVLFHVILVFQNLHAQWTPLGAHVPASGHKVWGLEVVGEDLIWGLTYDYVTFAKPEYSLKSLDGGATWTATPIDIPSNLYALHIYPLDGSIAWLATSDEGNPISGKIFKTTDGGLTWVEQSTGFTGFNETPAGVYFWNEDEGVAFGATGQANYDDQISVYWTEDGGDHWTKVVPPEFPAQLPHEGLWVYCDNGFFDVQGDNVWFVTNGSRIYRSTDRGKTWTAHETGLTGSNNLTGIAFKDELNGIVVAHTPNAAARTSDGGITWEEIAIPSTPPAIDIVHVPGTDGTYVLHNATADWIENAPLTLVTYDDGDNWGPLSTGPNFDCMEFESPTRGFAGGIISNTLPGIFRWDGNPLRKPIFVNDDATGNNDGTSWTNAFPNLQDALAIAVDGDQIWVAEGVYLPGSDPFSTFLVNKNLHLYGGFAGTEKTLLERIDPADHPTVLSGDLNGDDVEDDFVTNRGDNVMTVVTVGNNVTDMAVIDGFTIRNGQADGTITNQELRGGGLYTRASVEVRNCLFTQNFAGVTGGGAYLYAGSSTDGITVGVSNCRFEKNRSDGNGGGLFLDTWGQNASFTVESCEFHGNEARWNGGGVGAVTQGNSNHINILVDSCFFTKNSTIEFNGSGLLAVFYGQQSSFVLNNSTFAENESALVTAAALWGSGPSASGNVVVSDCQFEQNMATYNAGLDVGSLEGANLFTYTVINCSFLNNEATDLGGALEIYGESPSLVTVDDCMFDGNTAGTKGGAILVTTNHPDFEAVIKNCFIKNNGSPTGAAVDASNFTENSGMTLDANVVFENCLMTGNFGQAGTISLSNFGTLKLLNCTIADNPAGGIVQNENSTLALQNTILFNNSSVEFQALTSNVAVTSLGGNLIRDTSFSPYAVPEDLQNVNDPEAMFMGADDYHLFDGSPAIDRGVFSDDLPESDLDGNPRPYDEGCPDIGAFESTFFASDACMTDGREVVSGVLELKLSPNPATEFLYLRLPENITHPLEVRLFDPSGKLLKSRTLSIGQPLELNGLGAGLYWVKVVDGEQVYTGMFSKI